MGYKSRQLVPTSLDFPEVFFVDWLELDKQFRAFFIDRR